ncbi:hypothetical protein [Candidatus Sarmatiella mevalonica]|nr:hypothetical protein [Candidatus Sarmatiella mevalonica]
MTTKLPHGIGYARGLLNQWTTHPEYFILNPNHFLLGLNSQIFQKKV